MIEGTGYFLMLLLMVVFMRKRMVARAIARSHRENARWGRDPLAGKTGDRFIDNPFFNSWAPGGRFDKTTPRRFRTRDDLQKTSSRKKGISYKHRHTLKYRRPNP